MISPVEPLVSVVLRTYDHAPFIAQSIESVLIQDAPFPFELVIGEDCSPDGTREIVAGYAERHPDVIRTVLPERNVGHGEMFEQTLRVTRGKLIAYLDGDDYWTSRAKLARQVSFLDRNPDCMSCFHDVSLIHDEIGQPSGILTPQLADQRFEVEDILPECFIPAPTMMFRRRVAEALPEWSFESPWIDWLIHIRAAMLGWVGYLPETLAAYRVHGGGMFSGMDRVAQLELDLPLYEQLLPELPDQRELIERCIAFRRCQLAVEQLAVPFDACVVLIDPRRELKPYFNGRHVRTLPRRDARAVTELEAIRAAASALSPAWQDYGSGPKPIGGLGSCYVVVPSDAREWMDRHPGLVEYLAEHGREASADDWCVVHELEPVGDGEADVRSRARTRVGVTVSRPLPAGLAGGNIEVPASDPLLPTYAIRVVGWVAGEESRVAAIDFEGGGELVWRAPVDRERADLSDAFPDSWRTAGFQTTFNALEVPDGEHATVVAVLADGERLPFAELTLDRVSMGEA